MAEPYDYSGRSRVAPLVCALLSGGQGYICRVGKIIKES